MAKKDMECASTYPKILTLANFEDGDVDIACAADVKTRIGEIVVPEQTAYIWGRGDPNGPPELMGEIVGDFEAAADADLVGTLIVEASNANDRGGIPLGEYNLARLRLGSTDPRQRIKVPLRKLVQIGPNSKLVFYLRLTTAATFDYGGSDFTMDCVTSCE